MMKEALLRFTVFSFSGQTHFQWECLGHFSDSIKIAIFKTLRRLDTTWNFACSITRVSTHEHEHWEHCLWTQSLLKWRFFEQLTLVAVSPARRRHGRQKVSIPECNLSGRLEERSTITLLPVRSHLWIDTFRFIANKALVAFLARVSLKGMQHSTAGPVWCVWVEETRALPNLLRVFFLTLCNFQWITLKFSFPENLTMVNLKSASFVAIMPLHEGLQSQIKP